MINSKSIDIYLMYDIIFISMETQWPILSWCNSVIMCRLAGTSDTIWLAYFEAQGRLSSLRATWPPSKFNVDEINYLISIYQLNFYLALYQSTWLSHSLMFKIYFRGKSLWTYFVTEFMNLFFFFHIFIIYIYIHIYNLYT